MMVGHFMRHIMLLAVTDPTVSAANLRALGAVRTKVLPSNIFTKVKRYFVSTGAYPLALDLHFSGFGSYMILFFKDDVYSSQPMIKTLRDRLLKAVSTAKSAVNNDPTVWLPTKIGFDVAQTVSEASLQVLRLLNVSLNDNLDTFISKLLGSLSLFKSDNEDGVVNAVFSLHQAKRAPTPLTVQRILGSDRLVNAANDQVNRAILRRLNESLDSRRTVESERLASLGLRNDLEVYLHGKADEFPSYISFPNVS